MEADFRVAGQQSAAISFLPYRFLRTAAGYVLLFLIVAVLLQLFTPIPFLAWLVALTRMLLNRAGIRLVGADTDAPASWVGWLISITKWSDGAIIASSGRGNALTEEQQWRKLELVSAVARKVWNGDKSKRPRYHRPAKKFQNEPSASTAGQNRPRPIIRLCE
jgi:hypothetical protein